MSSKSRTALSRVRGFLRESVSIAAFALVVMSARSSLADHYFVPSESMLPTVHAGDHIVVNKLAYGLRVPFTHLTLGRGVVPTRGDVIVLESPEGGTVLLKRVVAVAGDRVAVRDGHVVIGGKTMPIETAGTKLEEVLGEKRHAIDLDEGGGPDLRETTIPNGQVLVLGDNRGNSRDGRYFGFVSESAILGHAKGICLRDGSVTWLPLLVTLPPSRAFRALSRRRTPMSLVYYYSPMSSANRTTWAIEELGVPCERIKLDFAKGETRTPEFLKLNPNGKVPLLIVDGIPIFESVAILLHLGETYGVEKGLFPSPGVKRAEVFKWIAWASASLAESINLFLLNTSPRIPEDQRNAKAGELAKGNVHKMLDVLDASLAGTDYLVGNEFSFADLAVAGFMPYLRFVGFDVSPWRNVAAWSARCMARPAAGRVRDA